MKNLLMFATAVAVLAAAPYAAQAQQTTFRDFSRQHRRLRQPKRQPGHLPQLARLDHRLQHHQQLRSDHLPQLARVDDRLLQSPLKIETGRGWPVAA